jgi:integrase
MFHVVHQHDGKLIRDPVGHNRKEAERALDARRGDIARREYHVLEEVTFDAWADRWLAGFTGKESTRRAYGYTLDYARPVFGRAKVRDLRAADVRRLLDRIRREHEPHEVTGATLAKHLRQLGACLEAAIAEGYATANPVRKLHKTARPRVAKSRPAYYTDAELARLWPELAERQAYLNICKLAALTGMRQGELIALEWSDVDLLNWEVHVRQAYVHGIGVEPPKSNEPRTVDLIPQAAALLEGWLVESGGEGLVFENETGGYLDASYLTRRVLYPALKRAGVDRVGERGRERTFHSFRHSFARIALEHGAEITWVQKQLGHSSITITVDTYGSWARSAEKAQADRLEAAFPV